MLRTVFSIIGSMIVAFFVGWFAHAAIGNIYLGRAQVVEGDTLRLGRSVFQFDGVRSPQGETAQGLKAKDYLEFVITDKFIWCRHKGDMDGAQRVGHCYAGMQNLNDRMVAEGFARDCLALSNGRYASLEARAKAMGRGAWAEGGSLDLPEECRLQADEVDLDVGVDFIPDTDGLSEADETETDPETEPVTSEVLDDVDTESEPVALEESGEVTTEDIVGDIVDAEVTESPAPTDDDIMESDVEISEEADLAEDEAPSLTSDGNALDEDVVAEPEVDDSMTDRPDDGAEEEMSEEAMSEALSDLDALGDDVVIDAPDGVDPIDSAGPEEDSAAE